MVLNPELTKRIRRAFWDSLSALKKGKCSVVLPYGKGKMRKSRR